MQESLILFSCPLQDRDTSPPSCSATRLQSNCPAVCNGSSWSVSLAVSDNGRSGLAALQLQKGEGTLTLFHSPPPTEHDSGEAQPGHERQHVHQNKTADEGRHQHHQHHHRARLERGEPPLNVSEWALDSSQPLWVRYMSSCCSAQAEILVWDTAGNMRRCRLTSGQQKKPRYKSTDTSGTTQPALTGVISLFLGLLWSPLT